VETRCWGIGEFNPTNDDSFMVSVADYECSVGVIGTGFWRALEILQGMKNRCVERSLFSKKSDVYSYAMVCYEVLNREISLGKYGKK
jgi:serine/threonine protein kinase